MRFAELASARVAVWGYGREGRAALTAIRRRFPHKPITLICSANEALSVQVASDAQLRTFTGAVDSAIFADFDIVVKSPGISPYQPAVEHAKARGVQFTSGTALWFSEHRDARTICVTGTKGKSTTSAMIAHLLRSGGYRVALAGNIGLPLLELLEPDREPDCWVIELSSFQTREVTESIDVGVINNLYPEHLDWHGTLDRYYADKLALMWHAKNLVVNSTQPDLLAKTASHSARAVFGSSVGWHVDAGIICCGDSAVFDSRSLHLLGHHNLMNACAALTAIEAANFDSVKLAQGLAGFRPLPHRLQSLGLRAGIEFVNDSISTTPHASLAALETFHGRAVTLILGGYDRGIDWTSVAARFAENAPKAIITQGANGSAIAQVLRPVAANAGFTLHETKDLAAAVQVAIELTAANGVILLSPGTPSFDAFRDYAERGRAFAAFGGFDAQLIAGIEGIGIS